jgi:hypothetical protein
VTENRHPSERKIDMKKLRLPSLMCALLVSAFSESAEAGKRVIHGSECQISLNSRRDDDALVFYNALGVHTKSGDMLQVTCPIARHNTSNTNGLLDLEVRFAVITPQISTAQTATCYARSLRPDGTVHKFVQKSNSGFTFKVDFDGAFNSGVSGGSYVVDCDVPNFTHLLQILVSEP